MKIPTLFREYIWLVNTIRRAGRISLPEINERWIENEDLSGGVEMTRSTFNRHKGAIEDIFGLLINCDRRNGYKYYIANERVLGEDSVQNWMLATLSVGSIVSESLTLQDRILLEKIPSEGDYLTQVIEAMRRSVKIRVCYQRYGADEPKVMTFEPYCIKLFNKRWYVLGHFFRPATAQQEGSDYFGTFAFDRMKTVELTDEKFKIDPDFDAAEYFKENFGILVHDDTPMQRIVVRAYGMVRYYMRDLPLHHSQREIASTPDYADFELNMRPTVDFSNHLMTYSDGLKVLSPAWLADEVRSMHLHAAQLYEDEKA